LVEKRGGVRFDAIERLTFVGEEGMESGVGIRALSTAAAGSLPFSTSDGSGKAVLSSDDDMVGIMLAPICGK